MRRSRQICQMLFIAQKLVFNTYSQLGSNIEQYEIVAFQIVCHEENHEVLRMVTK